MVRVHGRCFGLFLAVFGLGLSIQGAVWGQKPEASNPNEAALRQAGKDYLAAILKNDRKAMAEFWLPGGTYVNDEGQSFNAREMIEAADDSKEAVRPAVKLTANTIRFLTPDSAIEDGTSESTPPGSSAPIKGRFSAVWVRQNGKWKLDSLRESRVATATSTAEQLAGLEPFLGEWSGQTENVAMHVTAKWNSTKTFMRREMSMTSGGKLVFSATQQIGWDPIRQQIRSWVFDNNGGYGEGLWSLEGNLWMVLARGVHPDGKTSKATHIFRFVDRNTVVWKSIDASVDGRPSKDMEVTLVHGDKPPTSRTATAPSTAAKTEAAGSDTKADAAKRAALLASDAWKRVEKEYKDWAAVQVIYTPQQMEQNKAKLQSEIEKLPVGELQQFIAELDGKLKLLLSKNAVEARSWLGQYLSIFTDGYRKKFIGEIPNFADLSSAQMQDEYMRLRAKILARQREQASFDVSRTQMVNQALKNDAAAQAAAYQAAAAANSGGVSTGLYQSQYNPRPDQHRLPPQIQMSVGPLGGVSYNLPGSSY
jgi:uncharacterized protein (TIGR02246 family)